MTLITILLTSLACVFVGLFIMLIVAYIAVTK